MTPGPDNHSSVRKVVLPSGKTIEVVYFHDEETATQPFEDLHLCPGCSSDLVYPMNWEEASEREWQLDLRCPNCEWSHTGVYPQEIVEQLDEELDNGTQVLVKDLKALVRANMEAEIERFIAALRADLIWPMDF